MKKAHHRIDRARRTDRKAWTLAFLLCSAMVPLPAWAQQAPTNQAVPETPTADAAGPQVQDIVVTAQRRSENLQRVPIAVTAVTAEQAAARGITGTLALTAVAPSLQINQTSNFGSIYIRGVGSNLADPTSEPSVATYVDGVYISSPQSNFFSFNNIERIEVLKGPQGTLFGRNATGGVIQVVTMDPSETPSAKIGLGYGNYNTFNQSFYGTTKIVDGLAADLAVMHENQADGYGRNVTLNKDIFLSNNIGVRSKWLWRPGPATEVRLTGDYSNMYNNNAYTYLPGVVPPSYGVALYAGDFNAAGNLEQVVKNEEWGVALRIDQELSGVKVTSITSHRESTPIFNYDSDNGPLTQAGSYYNSYARTWSQELQLTNLSKGRFDWVLGAFYFDLVGGYNPWYSVGGGFHLNAEQSTKAVATYGQATYHFDGGTSITGGLRWTTELQEMRSVNLDNIVNAAYNKMNHEKLTWRLAIDQQLGDAMVYASYNRGYKSGGYNLADAASLNKPPALQLVPSYDPEVVDAYEVGFKSNLFDHRVRLNASAFYYDYENIQLQQPIATGNKITNAAAARILGFEGEFEAAVTRHFTIRGAVSILDSKYKNFFPAPALTSNGTPSVIDASGNSLVAAPKLTANLGADYTTDIGGVPVTASVSAIHNDGFYWYPDNRLRQPAYTVVNGQVSFELRDKQFQVRLWMKNITNERYFISEVAVQGRGDAEMRAPPRTFGVSLLARIK